jgi:predicted Zn-ribbon and HTH transcriptional regulator
MTKQHCPKCDYEWESRVDDPKACPRCKTRLDYFKNPKGDD